MKDPLRPWLTSAVEEYARRKAAAEPSVVRWEWATKDDRALEPLYFELFTDVAPGRKLPSAPKRPKYGNVAYCLDAADRVTVARSYRSATVFDETFYAWEAGRVSWVLYDDQRKVIAVHRGELEDGRLVGYHSRGRYGGDVKRFIYRDGLLSRIEATRVEENGESGLPRVYEIARDQLGRLVSVRSSRGGKRATVYRPPAREERFGELLSALEARLIAEIPARVRALRLKETAYSLVVAFGGKGDAMFPPTLGIGRERERQALVAKAGVDLRESLWDVAEYDLYDTPKLRIGDPAIKKLAAAVNRQLEHRDAWREGYRAYSRVAAALRKLDWDGALRTTGDFVIFAVDYEGTGLTSALREAAGAKTCAAWKKRRWMP